MAAQALNPEPVVQSNVDSADPQTIEAVSVKAKKDRFESLQPVLEKLFELYPQLFGERFLPLKLGVFQELLAAHPNDFKRDSLKAALGTHTRSTRYLQSVAAGNSRHDLQGRPVDVVTPEHVLLAIVELFRRRQGRTQEDLRPKLCRQLTVAYETSKLTRQEYLSRVNSTDEVVNAVLEQALDIVDQQRARQDALVRAFDASGKTPPEFADMLGLDVRDLKAALARRVVGAS